MARLAPVRLRDVSCAVLAVLLAAVPLPAGAQDFQQRKPDPSPAAPKPPVLTRAPRIKKNVDPVYPAEALAAGISADVTLQIDIDADGHVTAAQVKKPAGQGFDEAAAAAATEIEFEPAEIDGKPGPIRIEYTIHFVPKQALPQAPEPASAAPVPLAPAPVLAPPVAADVVVIRGRIREKGTRDPVAGADVALSRTAGSAAAAAAPASEVVATTDADGRFEVRGAPGGRARLLISAGDHETCIRDIDLPAAGAPPIDLQCIVDRRRGGPRYETVVQAPREGEEVTRHSLSRAELTTVPGTFGDPLRVIQNLPGVARMPYGLGLLVIRGASPQDSGVYVDGHKVPLLYHFAVGPSVLTPALIDRIDFYPGGFGVRYGRATAGVVDVTTRTDPVARVHGSADINFLDSSAYVEGPLPGGVSGSAAARRSYIDVLLPLVIPQRQGSATVIATPVYWDYQTRATKELGRYGRLSLFIFGSHDSIDVVSSDPARGDVNVGTDIGFHRVIAAWAISAGGWTSRLSPSYGYDSFGLSAGKIGGQFAAHVLGLREELSRKLSSSLRLVTGLDGELRFDGLDFEAPLPLERRTYGRTMRPITHLQRTLANSGAAAYVEALWDPHPHLRLVPGLRFDWFDYSATDKTSFDPRIVMRWTPRDTFALKLGAGVFHQPPLPQQLDAQFGNPRLRLMWADQYHVGVEQGFTAAVSLDATVYYLRRHDMALASARTDLATGAPERYASAGRGRAYGLELRLKHAVTHNFYGWISYTLSRSEVIGRVPEPGAPAPDFRPTQFDQTHNLSFVASRTFGAWEVGARFRLVSGIPETPLAGSTFDGDFNSYEPRSGAPFSVRRQTFHQLDGRVERTFTFDVWRFSIFLDLQNVYNAENPEATIYDYRYRKSAPVRGLPILPILGLRGRF